MYIGIDIGGTNVRIASFEKDSYKLLNKISFEVNEDFDQAIAFIIKKVHEVSEGNSIEGIGVIAPGDIDTERGFIDDSTNLPSWNKKPITEPLAQEFNTKVKLDIDVKASGLGEAMFGHGKDTDKFLFVIWGTGFSGTFVRKVNDKLDAIVAQIGHQILVWDGPKCKCGQHGCTEVFVGGGQSEETYGNKFSNETDEETWNVVAKYAGHALVNAVNYFPVNLVVFGGGVVSKQEHLIDKVKEILNQNLKTHPVPTMKLSSLGEDIGLYGALALLL